MAESRCSQNHFGVHCNVQLDPPPPLPARRGRLPRARHGSASVCAAYQINAIGLQEADHHPSVILEFLTERLYHLPNSNHCIKVQSPVCVIITSICWMITHPEDISPALQYGLLRHRLKWCSMMHY
jgi:hypothetical protein